MRLIRQLSFPEFSKISIYFGLFIFDRSLFTITSYSYEIPQIQCYNNHMITSNDSDITINIQKILGTDCLIKNNSSSALRLLILDGFPFGVFESVQNELRLSHKQLSSILGISTRTLTRRKIKNHFTSVESNLLYRIARVLVCAVTVFGDIEKARVWLKRPNRGLGGEIPYNLLNTDIGSQQVEDILNRIKFGIYS